MRTGGGGVRVMREETSSTRLRVKARGDERLDRENTAQTAAVYSSAHGPKGGGEQSGRRKEKTKRPASLSINRPRLLHAVVGLGRRHVRRLGEKVLVELGQKPEREREDRGGGGGEQLR